MYNNNTNQEQSGFAIASMILGIISLVISCCIPIITFVLAFIGFILGIVSLANKMGGSGMAITGIITSFIGLIISILCFLFAGLILFPM